MGAADSVPGVSGGTIAFITGIYERLIGAIASLDPRAIVHLGRLHRPGGRQAFVAELRKMDVPFLIALGTGVLTSLVLVSRVMHVALNDARALTFAFFFGLIAASAVVLYDQVSVATPSRIGAAVLGFGLAFFVSGVTAGAEYSHALPFVFGAGTIAITAMILPGVSGAFFLVLLGQYDYLTTVLKRFVDRLVGLVTGDATLAGVLDLGATVVTFAVGALLGLLVFARIVEWALANYRYVTLTFLVSLMVGALRLPVIEVLDNTATWSPVTTLVTVLAGAIGVIVVLLLDYYTESLAY
ncbi:DUF368 domain-containing protein [Halorhabdus sp. CUG00001]|uniref:DUF368 domain-containing protein n=1 Tax=Halorhabdus sp. CUG00001 TaxID=2600297 RepID=UPI00131C345E|nr:DUF368 domain-containing protein [Halorhabdus sp. CUG00001]